MKKLFSIIALLFCVSFVFADTLTVAVDTLPVVDTLTVDTPVIDAPVTGEESNSFLSLVLPAILGIFVVLFADTAKHLKSSTWNFKTFLVTKLKPAAITIILILLAYFGTTLNIDVINTILQLLGANTEIFSIAFGGTLAAVIDGLTKSPKK